MKHLILLQFGLIIGALLFIMSANKHQTEQILKNREIIKKGLINDAYLKITTDSILKYKVKEHNDGCC